MNTPISSAAPDLSLEKKTRCSDFEAPPATPIPPTAGFALGCAGLQRVRDIMGLTNLKIIIQFWRRVERARKVIEAMAQHGLKRGEGGLQIFMMCEIPNNVLLIDQIAQLFDGFSIGSNDLTQLTLGVDRHSSLPLISTSVTRACCRCCQWPFWAQSATSAM